MRAWTEIGMIGAGAALALALATGAQAQGDPREGERLFRACAACHSLEPGEHMTGPSLAGIFGRQAATVEGFTRYSEALQSADIVWGEETLDEWLADPAAMVPGNMMGFPGIEDPEPRAHLIAFLKEVSEGGGENRAQGGAEGGMGGGRMPDLAGLGPEQQVTELRRCGDTYQVTTAAGETLPVWEFNLRIKTDSSEKGPPEGQPALLRAGMMGDRVFVVFADPREISTFIEEGC
jgi:cytochrome c